MKAVRDNMLGLLLAGGLLLAPQTADAIDFKVKGAFDISFETSNVLPRGIKGSDTFGAMERLRTQIDAIASENVSGSLMFTVGTGTMNWGRAADGASLGADGTKNLGVRHAYIDWIVPKTDVKVRMGMQPQLLPGYVTDWSAVYGQYSTGVTVSSPLATSGEYKFGVSGFWARPYNDNSEITQNGQTQKNYLDNLDLFALTLPITGNGMKITPWGMYGLIGQNSLGASTPIPTSASQPSMLRVAGSCPCLAAAATTLAPLKKSTVTPTIPGATVFGPG